MYIVAHRRVDLSPWPARVASMQGEEGGEILSDTLDDPNPPASRATGLPVICKGLVTLEFVGGYSIVLPFFYLIEICSGHHRYIICFVLEYFVQQYETETFS